MNITDKILEDAGEFFKQETEKGNQIFKQFGYRQLIQAGIASLPEPTLSEVDRMFVERFRDYVRGPANFDLRLFDDVLNIIDRHFPPPAPINKSPEQRAYEKHLETIGDNYSPWEKLSPSERYAWKEIAAAAREKG
jgi:hypothetical protein